MFREDFPFVSSVRHLEIIASDPVMFHFSNLSAELLDAVKTTSDGVNSATLGEDK